MRRRILLRASTVKDQAQRPALPMDALIPISPMNGQRMVRQYISRASRTSDLIRRIRSPVIGNTLRKAQSVRASMST